LTSTANCGRSVHSLNFEAHPPCPLNFYSFPFSGFDVFIFHDFFIWKFTLLREGSLTLLHVLFCNLKLVFFLLRNIVIHSLLKIIFSFFFLFFFFSSQAFEAASKEFHNDGATGVNFAQIYVYVTQVLAGTAVTPLLPAGMSDQPLLKRSREREKKGRVQCLSRFFFPTLLHLLIQQQFTSLTLFFCCSLPHSILQNCRSSQWF
jgi:hypothetical protein